MKMLVMSNVINVEKKMSTLNRKSFVCIEKIMCMKILCAALANLKKIYKRLCQDMIEQIEVGVRLKNPNDYFL